MTSEKGLSVVMAGCVEALREMDDLHVVLVGDPARLDPEMARQPRRDRMSLHPASQVIGMDEEPGQAFKSKKDASVSVALRLVAEGKVQAAVSPGNTGASVVAATLTLGRLQGIRRPAILMTMPHGQGYTCVLDGGAVVDCKPEDLCQFGVMASLYVEKVMGKPAPRVGLLSIGEEEIKGNEQSHAAFQLLKNAGLNFIGNVEGGDLFNGGCDVAVCDGFVGNIVLKTAEGLARMIREELKKSIRAGNLLVRLGGLLSRSAFNDAARRINPDEYGGAVLLGVQGNFIIAHGSANEVAIKNAVRLAHTCASQDFVAKLGRRVASSEPAAR